MAPGQLAPRHRAHDCLSCALACGTAHVLRSFNKTCKTSTASLGHSVFFAFLSEHQHAAEVGAGPNQQDEIDLECEKTITRTRAPWWYNHSNSSTAVVYIGTSPSAIFFTSSRHEEVSVCGLRISRHEFVRIYRTRPHVGYEACVGAKYLSTNKLAVKGPSME